MDVENPCHWDAINDNICGKIYKDHRTDKATAVLRQSILAVFSPLCADDSVLCWNDGIRAKNVAHYRPSSCFNPQSAMADYSRGSRGLDWLLKWWLTASSCVMPKQVLKSLSLAYQKRAWIGQCHQSFLLVWQWQSSLVPESGPVCITLSPRSECFSELQTPPPGFHKFSNGDNYQQCDRGQYISHTERTCILGLRLKVHKMSFAWLRSFDYSSSGWQFQW